MLGANANEFISDLDVLISLSMKRNQEKRGASSITHKNDYP